MLSLEEVKLYLRIDGDEEDALIRFVLDTAQELCEGSATLPFDRIRQVAGNSEAGSSLCGSSYV